MTAETTPNYRATRIRNTEIYRNYLGQPIMTGVLVDDHPTNPRLTAGTSIYTSKLRTVDFDTGLVQTLNTLYQMVSGDE